MENTIGRNSRSFKKEYKDKRDIAYLYYSIITVSHGIKVSKLELELLAHISTVGNIASINSRADFITRFDSCKATLYNMISKLTKVGLLVKVDNKTKINPQIALDFINNDKFIFGVKCLYQKPLVQQ